jgi:hypothetical protein
LIRDVEQVEVKIVNMEESTEIQEVLDRLPNEVKGAYPQAKVPKTGHVPGALRDEDLRQPLASPQFAVIHALSKECQEDGEEGDVPVSSQ